MRMSRNECHAFLTAHTISKDSRHAFSRLCNWPGVSSSSKMTVSGLSSASSLTSSASFPAPRYVLYSVMRSVVSSLHAEDENAGATCQQRCGPHGVRRLERLERLANNLKARSIRQAPELLQAVSDAQSKSVAVPLALYLDARLSRNSTGPSSKPAKKLTKRQPKQL